MVIYAGNCENQVACNGDADGSGCQAYHSQIDGIAVSSAAPRSDSLVEKCAQSCRDAGYRVRMLGDALEGEAGDMARAHALLAAESAPGTVLLSGGEATVTVIGGGRGGPTAEYALALALALAGRAGVQPPPHLKMCSARCGPGPQDLLASQKQGKP